MSHSVSTGQDESSQHGLVGETDVTTPSSGVLSTPEQTLESDLHGIQSQFQSISINGEENEPVTLHFTEIDTRATLAFNQAMRSLNALEETLETCTDIEPSMTYIDSEIAFLSLLKVDAELKEVKDERLLSFKRESISRVHGFIGAL